MNQKYIAVGLGVNHADDVANSNIFDIYMDIMMKMALKQHRKINTQTTILKSIVLQKVSRPHFLWVWIIQ